jgi:hypothetical protein
MSVLHSNTHNSTQNVSITQKTNNNTQMCQYYTATHTITHKMSVLHNKTHDTTQICQYYTATHTHTQ